MRLITPVSPDRTSSEPTPETDNRLAFLTQLHPLDYLRVLYRRRWLGAAVVVVAAAAAAVYNAVTVPIYSAQATVLIESDRPSIVAFEEVLNEGLTQDGYYQTQLQLLTSRAVAARTVQALTLNERRDFGPTSEAAAIDAVVEGLDVRSVRGTRMVTVRFRSPSAAVAADVANAHARQYIEQSLDTRFTASKEATDWLNGQLTDERERVARSEAALQTYREQNDAVALGPGQDIVVQKLSDLNAAVTRAKTNRLEKEARYRALAVLEKDHLAIEAVPAIMANPFIQQLKGRLAELQREHSQLSESLGELHPTLVAKTTEVTTTERRLATEVARVVDSVRNEYQAAQGEETSMVRALEGQKAEALSLNRRGIEYAALQREAESVRQVYQGLLQRAKETAVSGDLRSSNIRIVDAARLPVSPTLPRSRINLLLGLLSGLLLAVVAIFSLEYVDDRARTPDDVHRSIRVRVIGLLPELKGRPSRTAALLQANVPPTLVESVRALRTGLLSAMPAGPARSIVVASGSEGEGKSFVASSLAIALARARQRVLLLDTDMRRPCVHTLFDQPLEPGLSGLLDGEVALADVLRETSTPGLTVLPAGMTPADPPELLGSPRFAELFRTLQQHYDWVIVDSPPVLNVTDASVVARAATGLVFVVASGRTTSRAARLAIDELRTAGANVLGVVLTRADLNHHPYYFAPYARGVYHTERQVAERPQAATVLGRSA